MHLSLDTVPKCPRHLKSTMCRVDLKGANCTSCAQGSAPCCNHLHGSTQTCTVSQSLTTKLQAVCITCIQFFWWFHHVPSKWQHGMVLKASKYHIPAQEFHASNISKHILKFAPRPLCFSALTQFHAALAV